MTRMYNRHGLRNTPEYVAWANMVQRCHNQNHPKYNQYGARGIRICDRWSNFELFLEDMGWRPSSGYSLDRIDNDGNYEPTNCEWSTLKDQLNNRTISRMIEFEGRTQTIAQWAAEKGMRFDTLWSRLKRGWSVERALS